VSCSNDTTRTRARDLSTEIGEVFLIDLQLDVGNRRLGVLLHLFDEAIQHGGWDVFVALRKSSRPALLVSGQGCASASVSPSAHEICGKATPTHNYTTTLPLGPARQHTKRRIRHCTLSSVDAGRRLRAHARAAAGTSQRGARPPAPAAAPLSERAPCCAAHSCITSDDDRSRCAAPDAHQPAVCPSRRRRQRPHSRAWYTAGAVRLWRCIRARLVVPRNRALRFTASQQLLCANPGAGASAGAQAGGQAGRREGGQAGRRAGGQESRVRRLRTILSAGAGPLAVLFGCLRQRPWVQRKKPLNGEFRQTCRFFCAISLSPVPFCFCE
jgi:hypothetical protein